MGRIFRYIADSALVPVDPREFDDIDHDLERCRVCQREATLYDVSGSWTGADEEEQDIGEACANCIRCGLIRQYDLDRTKQTLAEYARSFYADDHHIDARIQNLQARLDRTPCASVSFMQSPDWPACCGDLTEYIGNPKWRFELRRLRARSTYWERGVQAKPFDCKQDRRKV